MNRLMVRELVCVCLFAALAGAARADVTEEGRSRFTPWSGYWWPHARGQLLVPLGKYDQLTGKAAAKWEREHHPPGDNVPKWHGYCHAWSASSLMEAEPVKAIQAALAAGRVDLGVGDQKGLLAVSHGQDVANAYGDRFGDRQGSEDKQDLAPERLWHLLKLYVKQEGVPLVVDVEADAEVWNYPVYAYRVTYAPQGSDGLHAAQMTIWMADDAVPPDYVGIKVRRQSYQFTFKLRNRAVVMGSGKWTGPSVKDHPDFAWYPYVAVPENPEVDYPSVRKILGLGPVASANPPDVDPNAPLRVESGTTPPTTPSTTPPSTTPPSTTPPSTTPPSTTPPSTTPPSTTPPSTTPPSTTPPSTPATPNRPNTPPPSVPDNPPPPPAVTPNAPQTIRPPATPPAAPPRPGAPTPTTPPSTGTNPASGSVATNTQPAAEPVIVLSPWELVALIANKTSSFALDVTIDRFDGGQYAIGDNFSLRVTSEREGYLYLLHIDAQGELTLLYPRPGQPNRVTPQTAFEIPGPKDKWVFQAAGPVGQARVKAVVTSRPLVLSGLLLGGDNGGPGRDQSQQPHSTDQKGRTPAGPQEAQQVMTRLPFRWHPTQAQAIQQLLLRYHRNQPIATQDYGGIQPAQVLGAFAQDEVAYYAGPVGKPAARPSGK